MPLFEELRETSQGKLDWDSNSNVSWDVSLNSSKSGMLRFFIFRTFVQSYTQRTEEKKNAGGVRGYMGSKLCGPLADGRKSLPQGGSGVEGQVAGLMVGSRWVAVGCGGHTVGPTVEAIPPFITAFSSNFQTIFLSN